MPSSVSSTSVSTNWRVLDLSFPLVSQNLALEEALARGVELGDSKPTIRFWTNPCSAVIGRFQQVESEVDVAFCERSQIPIARRFTGGGAVFHDAGNLNFTIAGPRHENVPMSKMQENNSSIVLQALEEFGLEASYTPPNSIEVSGKKVSGAAAALGRGFAFWHASILISTDTKLLSRVLRPSRSTGPTKFVHSRWKQVTTLEDLIGVHVDVEDIKTRLLSIFEKQLHTETERRKLTSVEQDRLSALHTQKYTSREWTFTGVQEGTEG